jgi:hypothetical protein
MRRGNRCQGNGTWKVELQEQFGRLVADAPPEELLA